MSAPYREPTYVSDLPEVDRSYPVIVVETRRYVLWIEAETPAEAVEQFGCDPHDPGRGSLYWFDYSAEAPDRWDWADIERSNSDGDWSGTAADAHVQAWRNHHAYLRQKAAKDACAAAGHPVPEGATGPWAWADYCGTCGYIDPSERTTPDHAAAGGEPKATTQEESDLGGGS